MILDNNGRPATRVNTFSTPDWLKKHCRKEMIDWAAEQRVGALRQSLRFVQGVDNQFTQGATIRVPLPKRYR